MKPNDANGQLPTSKRPFRVLLIAGSARRQFSCPTIDSKARSLMFRMADRLPKEWEVDVEDIGNVWGREQIGTCNACVSTSMALCVWPCNCYSKQNSSIPDLMWNLDLYARLDLADAWAIIGPVNWYGPTSNLKAMFDRLVCMNGGNPNEATIAHKDPDLAIALEHSPQWEAMSQNHLEGRSAAFFSYGDSGGDELDDSGRPKILRHRSYFEPADEPFKNMRDAYRCLVWQCRYGGIEVPDALWRYCESGVGKKYSDNQAEDMASEPAFLSGFDAWTDAFAEHVAKKGKVEPGAHRAYGYRPPAHLWADVKTKWRAMRMAMGLPIKGSSAATQQAEKLNRDVTLFYKKGEGAKARDVSR